MDIDFRLPAVPADEQSLGLEVDSLSEQAVELLLGTIDDPDPATSPEAVHAAGALAEDVRIWDRYEAVVFHYAHRGSSRTSSIDGYRAAELPEAASKTSGNVEPLQHQVMLGTLTAADFEEGEIEAPPAGQGAGQADAGTDPRDPSHERDGSGDELDQAPVVTRRRYLEATTAAEPASSTPLGPRRGQALAGAGDDQFPDELGQGREHVEHQPPAWSGGVQVLVQRGEADLTPAQLADCGDQILQGTRQPVQRRHHQGVPGRHELQARGQLGPVGVAAGLLLGEDAPAAGGP